MRRTIFLLTILCFFVLIPQIHAETDEIAETDVISEAETAETVEPVVINRRPLIKTDNSFLGLPEYMNFQGGIDGGYDDVLWIGAGLRIDYSLGPFAVSGEISFLNDQKYSPAAALLPAGDLGGFYFLLNEGGITYNGQILQIAAGRFRNYDETNSPYSLFLNSDGISANTFKIRLESKYVFYQTQWIQLNWSSGVSSPAWNEYQRRKQNADTTDPLSPFYPPNHWYQDSGVDPWDTSGLLTYGFPDRGLNIKIYGLKVKDWRFGFIDAALYSQRPFDLEYFLIPLPMYFVQYFRTTEGRPWATQNNDKSIMGFFWDLDKKSWDAYAQLLIADFSFGFLNVFLDEEYFSPNPWKLAWSLGGRVKTKIGNFGFHHAGALKYTFNPIGTNYEGLYAHDAANTAYGYTYYPETRYFVGNDAVNLTIQENMIGYKHGENNIAFQIDYQNTFYRFVITSELEFVLAGSNSPANPWHDYDRRVNMYADGKKGSQIFNDPQLEKRIEFRLNVSRQFGRFGTYAAIAIGGRFNRLELVPPDIDPHSGGATRTVDDEIWIWKASDKHSLIFRMSIGFRYFLPII
ncbi:MAG: hypothetical protein FWD26_04735 [Treponema sp.]|nr:hypothetical protein [Treponema sp.]